LFVDTLCSTGFLHTLNPQRMWWWGLHQRM